MGLTGEIEINLNIYEDSSKIPNYGKYEVSAATQNQPIVNYPKINKLNPNQPATRAEVAVMVYQVLVQHRKVKGIYSPYIVGGWE